MKEYNFSPSPHVDVCLRVTEEMAADLHDCWKKSYGNGKDCDGCSWRDVMAFGVGMCELPEVIQSVFGDTP